MSADAKTITLSDAELAALREDYRALDKQEEDLKRQIDVLRGQKQAIAERVLLHAGLEPKK